MGRPIPADQGGASGGPVIRDDAEAAEEGEGEELAQVRGLLSRTPAWLVSMVFHLVVLVILGLIYFSVGSTIVLDVDFKDEWAEEIGEQLEEDKLALITDEPQEEQIISDADLPEVLDPLSAPPDNTITERAIHHTSQQNLPHVGNHLTGREVGRRRDLLAAYGGTRKTQEAVIMALEWLARNQRADGSWSLRGPYDNGSYEENEVAATAMALLAFQGIGSYPELSDHSSDKEALQFRENVRKGWPALLKHLDKDGNFIQTDLGHARLYSQAQATIALCELYALSKRSENEADRKKAETYGQLAQQAINYAVAIQDRQGGWRYVPGNDSDLSVTGWFVMALQSARMADLDVPVEALEKVSQYLDTVELAGGSQYRYRAGQATTTNAMTAEGLLCRQYLGWQRGDQRLVEGAAFLNARPMDFAPGRRDVYYWYYATQVLHHMEGPAWRQWNDVMRNLLPNQQIQDGRERGSWDPRGDTWGPQGGRLYVTCLTTYCLQVYYRHLPLYTYSIAQ